MPDFPDASVFQIITLYVSIFIQKYGNIEIYSVTFLRRYDIISVRKI